MKVIKFSSHQADEANRRGNDLLQNDELDKALKEFDQAIKFEPEHAAAMYNLGYVHYLLGHYKKAAGFLKKASKLDPKQPGIYVNLAHIYGEMMNSPRKALSIIKKALNILPDSAEVHVSMGDHLMASGKMLEAREEFIKALELEPDNDNAQSGMAEIMNREALIKTEEGDHTSGVFLLKRAIKEYPSETFLYTNLGILYFEMGDPKKAEEVYNKACELDPANPVPHFNLGYLYLSNDEKDKARAEYEWVLELDPAYPDVHTELAEIYAEDDDYESAFALLNEGKALRPDDERIFCSLGFYSMKTDDFESADKYLGISLHIDPEYFSANYHMARLMGIKGEIKDGIKHLNRAFDLDWDEAAQWCKEDMASGDPGIKALSESNAFWKLMDKNPPKKD